MIVERWKNKSSKVENQNLNYKEKFIREELATNSLMGAFQHAGIYQKGIKITDKAKNKFREFIRTTLYELEQEYKSGNVSDEEHIRNIQVLVNKITKNYSSILGGGKLRIGIAQKLLNLYLKYLWCIGIIPTPPHCPFDGIVYKLLAVSEIPPFTKMDSLEQYKELVNLVRQKAKEAGDPTIADWEVRVWKK